MYLNGDNWKKRIQTKPCGKYICLSVNVNVCDQHSSHIGECCVDFYTMFRWLLYFSRDFANATMADSQQPIFEAS
jgi:hypothetical protein